MPRRKSVRKASPRRRRKSTSPKRTSSPKRRASPKRSVSPTRKTRRVKRTVAGARRKLTPFFKFRKDVYPQLKKQYPNSKVTVLAKKMGAMWRSLTPSEKKVYMK